MKPSLSRRQVLITAAAASASVLSAEGASATPRWNIRYGLNTATLRHFHLDLPRLAAIAVTAGYRSIEPWLDEIERYIASGGSAHEFSARAHESGLTIENVIAFPEWLTADPLHRAATLDKVRRSMDLVASVGGHRIAAPPSGATDTPMPLATIAERYGALLKLGKESGVIPQLEIWGFSANVRTLADAAWIAVQTGDASARIIPDMMHLFRSGSPVAGLQMVAGHAIDVFHMNDYPASVTPASAQDTDRRFPGSGVAPLTEALQALRTVGFEGALSLEVFGAQAVPADPLTAAREGLRSMKATVENSLRPETHR